MLVVRDLYVHYGPLPALRGVTLEVLAGGLVAVLGGNGAGKSTLMRAISGLQRAGKGTITFEGRPIEKLDAAGRVALGIVQVPEGRRIFPDLTVAENLRVGTYGLRDRHGWQDDLEQVVTAMPRLRERIHQYAGTLSGGEQSMLALGRAMMARPRLLLLDEPTMGLSPLASKAILGILHELHRQGTTVLLVEQSARLALQLAQYAYILVGGKVALEGASAELQGRDEVRRSYLGIKTAPPEAGA